MTDVPSASAPLDKPLYGARFGQAVSRFWRNYLTFSGRASRSEYRWAALFNGISYVVVALSIAFAGGKQIDPATGHLVWGVGHNVIIVLQYLWFLAVLLPTLSITWRRLHDTNRPGAFFFLAFVPVVGALALLVLLTFDSDPAGARFDQS